MRPRSKANRHNAYKRAVIDDVSYHRIDDTLREPLLRLFEYAMRSIATTYTREAVFDFAGIESAKGTPCARYYVQLERTPLDAPNGVFWCAVILPRDGRSDVTTTVENIEILAHLEDHDD
jgi:hypothetical protein